MSLNKFQLSFFLLLFIPIKTTDFKNGDILSLIIYEYSFEISEFKLDILNSQADIKDDIDIRLAYLKNEKEEDKNIFEFYSNYINHNWLFFANSTEVIDRLLKINYEDYRMNLAGILIPKEINYKLEDKNEDISVFEINNNLTEIIDKLDIRIANKDIFFTLKIVKPPIYCPAIYLILIAIFILISSVIVIFLWNIKIKSVPEEHILYIHYALIILIFSHFLIGIFLLIKAFSLRGKKVDSVLDDNFSVCIDSALITLDESYQTELWFIILLLSYGWCIAFETFNNNEIKIFKGVVCALFLISCSGIPLDALYEKAYGLYPSEIKEIIFHIFFTIILVNNIDKNIKIIKLKYYFANIVSQEFNDVLLFKLNLFRRLRLLLIYSVPVFFLFLFIPKIFFYKYNGFFFTLYNNYIVNITLEISLLIIFKPRLLPDNYNIVIGNELDEGKIFKCKLPQYEKAHNKIKDLTKKQVNLCKNDELPILIIGPNNINNSLDENNYDINNYFSNLRVGYAYFDKKI